MAARFASAAFLEIPLSRGELAQLIGTTQFTVSRLLCQWEAQGIVTLRRQGLEIISLEELKRGGDDPYSLVPAYLKPKPSAPRLNLHPRNEL